MLKSRSAAFGAVILGGVVLAFLVGRGPSATAAREGEPDEKKAADKTAEKPPAPAGDAEAGRDVFRFETFGNEGFWTDAMRLPKGMEDEKFTPLDALKAGLHVDAEAVPADLKEKLAAELKTDLSPEKAPLLNDPKTTMKLVKANAVIGVVPKGEKVGISCAICHTITDNSVFELPGKGSVGRRLDGRATHSLDMGPLLALAANSRAYHPNLQLELGGKTIGRAPKGIRRDSTEAEVDAYLKNPEFYPRGTFDETQDGIGNPVQNTPLFRQDLAGPYGSAGEFAILDHISNASYTTNLDPTSLVTPEGREFLKAKAGKLGEEMADNYEAILKETGVKGYPFVTATTGHKVGDLASPVGRKVDMQKVRDMSAYLKALPAPKGEPVDAKAAARGRELFRANCTKCHNEDQSKPVPTTLVDLKELWPAYKPETLGERKPPLSPIVNSPGGFDDKMVVVDASDRGEKRGNAVALLLDLARKPMFLHDASVPSLDALLDPTRGADAPHPFYLKDKAERADLVVFLKGLDTSAAASGKKDAAPPKPGVVYVVSNDPVEGGNAVLGYRDDGTGSLTPLPGSPFKTGGTGYATKSKLPHFGPFDLDQNIIANPERSRVFVTNGGSDTVAVFDIQGDGGLKPVKGSPFPSGGKNPVSLGLAGDRLYVVNKNDDPGRDMTKTLPNYTGFTVGMDGSLTPIPKSTLELTTPWRSPTQALVVEGKYLFDGDFGNFPLPSRTESWGKEVAKDTPSSIRSFKINSDGTLHQHPPMLAPKGEFDGGMDVNGDGKPDPLIFGLQVHPKQKLIYIGFVTAAKLGVYRYDGEGRLTFVRAVPNKGKLICWIKINKAGTRAYTTNNGDNTVSVYDLSDAESPKEIQTMGLKGHGHPYQIDLSPDERTLYVVKHRTFNETPVGDGSVLNVLHVEGDGMLREAKSSPVTLPVRDDLLARPQGVLAVTFPRGLEIPGSGDAPKLDPPAKDGDLPAIKKPAPSPRSLPTIPPPDAAAAEVPPGYKVEIVLTGLQYPSSVEFDDKGSMYVAEAGNIDGDWVAPARVIKYTQNGPNTRTTEVVADNLMGPVTDLLWHQGKLYISHRGKISVLEKDKVRDLVTDLPSFGDHHNNQMTVGPDGKIYFGQGSATNSGVVGVDNYLLGWLAPYPDFSDRPGRDITLRGQTFESADPLAALGMNKARTVKTSAFQPFGKTVPADAAIKGAAKASAAVLRMDADGKNLECYAWGLRNPFGVMWGPDGKLYASDNGADERGVRPIANCPDRLTRVPPSKG